MRTYLGQVIRDIERKVIQSGTEANEELQKYLERATRIHRQQRQEKHKLYSLEAPEVECIAKGKEHKKYEFGCKVSVVTTSKQSWVVGIEALHGNPYDGHTLKGAHAQLAKLTGVKPEEMFVDKGYRWAKHHPENVRVYRSGGKLNGRLTHLLPTRSHRTSDWSLETRPSHGAQLSAGHKRRPDQRAVGGLRLQPEKTPASFLLAPFRLG